MAKAPTALQALKALPLNKHRTYRSRLKSEGDRKTFDELVAELKGMDESQRPSQRILAHFFNEQFGVKPSQSTIYEWLR
jgi:hypothetical protein